MLIIGVDPGVKGGLAIIPLYSFVSTQIYPFSKYSLQDLSELLKDMREGNNGYTRDTPVEVFLEEPSLSPYLPGDKCPKCKRGPTRNSQSFFKLGKSLGQLEGLFISHNCSISMVHPIKWQNAVNARTKGDKKVSRNQAIKMFPALSRVMKNGESKSMVTHDVADALLIALYGYLQYARYIPKSVTQNLDTQSLKEKTNGPTRTRPPSTRRSAPVPRRNGPTPRTARATQ